MEMISTQDNALDSLDRLTGELGRDLDKPEALKGALYWGWHAFTLLAHERLRPAKESFDHWFWDYLETGEPELEVERDSQWEEKRRLSTLELLDILSTEDLPLLKPEFFQGWQDRTTRCRTLRRRVSEVIGTAIGQEGREDLLLLLAAYHRLLRLPSDASFETSNVARALPALVEAIDTLIDPDFGRATDFRTRLDSCKKALAQ